MQHPSEFIRILMNPQNFTQKNIIRLNPQYVFFLVKKIQPNFPRGVQVTWLPRARGPPAPWPAPPPRGRRSPGLPGPGDSPGRYATKPKRDLWRWEHPSDAMPLDVGFCDLPLEFDVGFSMIFLVHTAFDHLKRTTYYDLLIAWDGHHWNFTWIKWGLKWTSSVPWLRITG